MQVSRLVGIRNKNNHLHKITNQTEEVGTKVGNKIDYQNINRKKILKILMYFQKCQSVK